MLRIPHAPPLTLLAALALSACDGRDPGSVTLAPGGRHVRVERDGEDAAYDRVVLVTLDTLRADHVSSYGYPRATTPFLDSLAARGVRFSRAMAAVSHTAPSHATMLTGLVPAVHGVVHNGQELAPQVTDLAELFGACGFETAAFLNVKFLTGIAASFGTVDVQAVGADRRVLDGGDVVDAAIRWLDGARSSERFFLWVHLYDPHKWKNVVIEHSEKGGKGGEIWPGETPPGFLAHIAELHGLPAPVEGTPYRVDWNIEKKGGEKLEMSDEQGFLDCIDAYDERTLFADRQVARLHEEIEKLALPGRTLWVVTADHGEGMASHGVAGHGSRIYQEQLHVPLILSASDGSLGPRVVDELVAHVDLMPTLAATLGALVRGDAPVYEGRSLWPLARGEGGWEPRAVFSQRRPPEDSADPERDDVFALQDGRFKLILHEPGADEFFDLASDPKELRDLGAEHADAAGLRERLAEQLRVFEELGAGEGEVDPAFHQELRDLGYVR